MTVSIAPGTPAPGNPASPAPGAVDTGSEPSSAPEGVVGPSPDEGDGDELSVARRKAREILFAKEEPEEGAEEPPAPAPAPPKVEEKPKDEIALSKEWARVSAQEKRLKEKQRVYLEQNTALQGEREAVLKAKQEHEALINDPVAFLSKAGWDKDKIVQWIQSDGKVEPEILIKQLSEKHQREMEELRSERKREQEELNLTRQTREMERVEGELGQEVKTMVSTDPELAILKRLVSKDPKKFEAFIDGRVKKIITDVWKKSKQAVDPRDALLYLQSELAELQLADPGQAPAVKPATPAAVEPTPITNQATASRTVRPVEYDESDPEQRRARAAKILAGEIDE